VAADEALDFGLRQFGVLGGEESGFVAAHGTGEIEARFK